MKSSVPAFSGADPMVASAGWALTTERVGKNSEELDRARLLDIVESETKDAQERPSGP